MPKNIQTDRKRPPPGARRRRSWQQIHQLTLQSALKVFGERGYDGTSTRLVAIDAGIAEYLVYAHFGTKDRLFEEAVINPFRVIMDGFTEQTIDYHSALSHAGAPGVREYVRALWTLIEDNAPLFRAMVISLQSNEALRKRFQHADTPFIHHMDRVAASGSQLLNKVNLSTKDIMIHARFTFGLVLTQVIFGDIFFERGKAPSRERLIQKMTAYIPYGKMKPAKPRT